MRFIQKCAIGAGVCIGMLCPYSFGQASALSDAATQPGKGRFALREQARFERYDLLGAEIDQWTIDTRIIYGLRKDVSLTLNLPTVVRDRGAVFGGDQSGLGDSTLMLKWRFWQEDPAPVDTNRLALIGGLRLPTGTDGLSSGGWDPFIGLTFTKVSGRHGMNASVRYTLSTDGLANPISAGTGEADLLTLEASWLYRLSPSEYTSETNASLYFTVESFVDYETNGDIAWRIAPGLLYEARRWTAELSPIIPIAQEIDNRAELEWGVAFGLRFLF